MQNDQLFIYVIEGQTIQ